MLFFGLFSEFRGEGQGWRAIHWIRARYAHTRAGGVRKNPLPHGGAAPPCVNIDSLPAPRSHHLDKKIAKNGILATYSLKKQLIVESEKIGNGQKMLIEGIKLG